MKHKGKYFRMILISMLIGIILITVIYGSQQVSRITLTEILHYTPASPVLAVFLLLGIYSFKGITMVIPLKLLFIIAGMIFPLGLAIGVTYCGLFLEMTVGFFLGRRLGSKQVLFLINKKEKAKKILELSINNGVLSSFLVRFIPGLPAELTSMFMGATKVKYPQYITGTLLGITPSMIPVVMIGDAVADPLSEEFLLPFAGSAVIALCSVLIYQKKIRRH